jgi:L-ascorbate metabolism protein UlaG (beta-lactamase superfamily)
LIDPGSYCYSENFKPQDWGKIDILLITHKHPDHCYPEAIKIIQEKNKDLIILTNEEWLWSYGRQPNLPKKLIQN